MSHDTHTPAPECAADEANPAADSLAVSVDGRTVTVSIDGDSLSGRVVDLRDYAGCPSPSPLTAQLPREADWRGRPEFDADRSFSTVTPEPPSPRRLAAVAARSRGVTTPVDDELAAVESIDTHTVESEATVAGTDPPDLAAVRERVAETGSEVERLREQVAMLRGRLQAARETDGDTAEVRTELDAAMRALTEAETDERAAQQRLDQVRQRARAHRNACERRLRRHDARRNRAREVRTHLATAVADRLAATTNRVVAATDRGQVTFNADTGTVTGDPVTFHLAALVVSETTEPVVVAVKRLGDLAALPALLDAPVIVCRPPA